MEIIVKRKQLQMIELFYRYVLIQRHKHRYWLHLLMFSKRTREQNKRKNQAQCSDWIQDISDLVTYYHHGQMLSFHIYVTQINQSQGEEYINKTIINH